MDIGKNSQQPLSSQQENYTLQWTAGSIISTHKGKAFDHTGSILGLIDIETYILKVFPPSEVAKHMQQPAPDMIHHLQEEDLDTSKMNREIVSFIAHVSLPYRVENSVVEITLKSEQYQNNGVYALETSIPKHMVCVRESPIDTVLDSLNNALHEHHWYPPY